MDKSAELLPDSGDVTCQSSSPPVHPDDYSQARNRVMAYLKALCLPEHEAAVYAAEALARAQREQHLHPVVSAMRALRAVLTEHSIDLPFSTPSDLSDVNAAPALNRSSMLPVELDRMPWWTFFCKYILRKKP